MKKMKFRLFGTVVLVLLMVCQLSALTIKLGTIAPLRSPWVDEIKNLDMEWRKITGGKVEIKIYAGGIAGSEEDMVRKIRMGMLGGAVFTNIGITQIQKDAYVLNMPFTMDTDAELDYVLSKLTPDFEKEIEAKGFKVVTWAKSGWLYFYSKRPIIYPEDLKKHKLSFAIGTPEMEQAWKKSGYQVIPTDLKDLLMALQSGMLDSAYLPHLLAASGQYFALIPHTSDLKVAPLVGGIVLSNNIWKQIPEEFKKPMIEAAKVVAARLYKKADQLEKDAINEMKKHGLIYHTLPPDALPRWKAAVNAGLDEVVGKAFSKEVYDKLIKAVNESRKLK